MEAILEKLEHDRWDWAFRGIVRFKKGFLRYQETEHDKKRVLIGVYGPTQVGKTTLILKLLGIRENRMQELTNAMRGRRTKGNSATITSTIYQQSANHQFVLIDPYGNEKTCETLTELEEMMMVIRQQVEADESYPIKPLVIKISRSFFDQDELNRRTQDIEILDLPGDDSREEKEVEHVERCLKEYLPLCKVCILMEIASQIVPFTQIDREYVRDWRWLPSNFRIVLTRAVTSSSIRKQIESGVIASSQSFIKVFYDELNRHVEDGTNDISVYPLEFGDSWDHLKHTDLNVYEKANPWMEEIFHRLVEDLSSVFTPENEVRQFKNLERAILKKSEDEKVKMEAEHTSFENELEEIKQSLIYLDIKMANITCAKNDVRNDIKELEHFTYKKQEFNWSIPRWDKRGHNERTTKALQSDFIYYYKIIEDELKNLVDSWNRTVKILFQKYNLSYQKFDYHFEPIYFTLKKKWYLSKTNFNVDCYLCEDKLKNYYEETFNNIEEQIRKKKEDSTHHLKVYAMQLLCDLRKVREDTRLEFEKKQVIEKQIQDVNIKREKVDKEWKLDMERARKLDRFLEDAFNEKSKEYLRLIESTDVSPMEKWLFHQYWNIMLQDACSILPDTTTIVTGENVVEKEITVG